MQEFLVGDRNALAIKRKHFNSGARAGSFPPGICLPAAEMAIELLPPAAAPVFEKYRFFSVTSIPPHPVLSHYSSIQTPP